MILALRSCLATDWAPPTVQGMAIAAACVLLCWALLRSRIFR